MKLSVTCIQFTCRGVIPLFVKMPWLVLSSSNSTDSGPANPEVLSSKFPT